MQIWSIFKIFVKLALWISAILFIAYLSVLLLFPKYVNIKGFKDNFEQQFFEQTGLYLNVERLVVEPAIRTSLNLDAHHAIVLYPDKKELFKAKDLTIKIRVLPIIFKKVEVEKIIINRPILSMSIDKEGHSSLDKFLNLKYSPKANGGFVVSENLPEILLNRYKVKIFDKMYSEPFIIEGEKLRISKTLSNGNKIETQGSLSQANKKYIDFSTTIESLLTKTPQKLFNTNPFRYLKRYEIKAKISSKIKIEENENTPKITGQADVTDLSFVLNGSLMKNNFINLKFNDDKIAVNADIKASPSDRIKLDGIVTTGKNLVVDIKCVAENINLFNLKSTAETLLNAMNIKNPLHLYSVQGRANLNFKIKSGKNHLASSGFAEIIGASVKGKNIPCKITNINSKINLENDTITIEPTTLLVNGTPVELRGTINSSAKTDIVLKGENLSVGKLIDFVPDAKIPDTKGIISFSANLKGNLNKPETLVLADLKNFTISDKGKILTKFEGGKVKITGDLNTPEGTISLTKPTILPTDLSDNLKAENLILNIKPNEIEIPNNKMSFGGAAFELQGKINDYQKQNPTYNFDIVGKLNSKALYNVIKKQKGTEKFLAATKGNVGINGNIKGSGDDIAIKADLMADKDNYISCLVIKELLNIPSITRLDAYFDGKNLNINDFSLNKNNGKKDKILFINGKIENVKKPYLNKVRVVIPNTMTFALAGLKNSEISAKSDLTINGIPEKPSLQGNLEVLNVNIPEYKLHSQTNKIVFASDNIKLCLPKLQIGNSIFNVETAISSNLKQPFVLSNLKLKSSYLDLNEISEIFENVQTNPVYPGVEIPIKAENGFSEISKFKIGGLQAENITSNISINNNILSMKNIKGTAYGGSVSGKSEYNFLKTLSLSEISGKNAQMSHLFKALTGKDDGTVGLIDYKLKLSSVGTKYSQQLRTSKGYMEYTATKGVMGPLGQFEHFLHAQNLISDSIFKMNAYKLSRAIKPQNTGVFTISKGKTEILNGIAIVKSLTVEGPKMSLYITGKVNLLNDVSDIKIYGRISQEIEDALGTFATRSSQTILTSSSETSIGNIFYDDYNTSLPKSVIDAIPQLNPNTGMSSRPFVVVIKGSPDNIKSVKSFKWIVDSTNAPSPVLRKVQKNPQTQNTAKPQQNNQNQTTTQQKQQTPIYIPSQLPSFMDNLPNNLN